MTSGPALILVKLAKQFEALSNKKASGQLLVIQGNQTVEIDWLGGNLIEIKGIGYPRRSFDRAITQNCPQWQPQDFDPHSAIPWQYQLCIQGLTQKKITPPQAKLILLNMIQEALIELGNWPEITLQWKTHNFAYPKVISQLSFNPTEVKTILTKALHFQQQWYAQGLSKLNPNYSPVSKQTFAPDALSGMGKYLDGNYTLWDISLGLNKPIHAITKALIPLAQKQVIQFKKISDLPISSSTTKAVPPPVKTPPKAEIKQPIVVKGKTIACIDDSPVIGSTLTQILTPYGHQVISILDPMKGLPQLMKAKPDLIFLDLILPTTNGYAVCQSLRKIPAFQKTPIIMLSSRDGQAEREKSKQVGANDYLTKPPEPDKVMAMLQKHLTLS